jgi:hypothetical protein
VFMLVRPPGKVQWAGDRTISRQSGSTNDETAQVNLYHSGHHQDQLRPNFLARSIVAICCRFSLLPFNRLQFIGDLAPLIDKIEVHHADCRVGACERTTLTLHRLLSTVVGPRWHSVPTTAPMRCSPWIVDMVPLIKFTCCTSSKDGNRFSSAKHTEFYFSAPYAREVPCLGIRRRLRGFAARSPGIAD